MFNALDVGTDETINYTYTTYTRRFYIYVYDFIYTQLPIYIKFNSFKDVSKKIKSKYSVR